MINVAIRADASHEIGIGHVMRCITLAQELKCQFKTVRIVFLCRKAKGCVTSKVLDAGFECIRLSSGFDDISSHLKHGSWLRTSQKSDAVEFKSALNKHNIDYLDLVIVDHYGIDQEWHKLVKKFATKIFVIDDLGDRTLDCEYLLDQTFDCKLEKYHPLVNSNCKLLLGTEYALLRPEFKRLPLVKHSRNILLVMFGGTDPDNLTLQTLKLISSMSSLAEIVVVLNDTAKHLAEVIEFCNLSKSIRLLVSPSGIAQIMSQSTLAIGAAGTTSWERCAAGLPTVVVIQAFNQREIASNLQQAGVISYIEAECMEADLINQVEEWFSLLASENNTKENCQNICDGFGASKLVKVILDDL